MAEFKDRLKELRKSRDLSQAELAEKIGVSVGLIGMYENGQRNPSKEKMEVIADFFNVSLDYITGKDQGSVYYFDPETAQMAETLKNDKNMRLLFDAARDSKPEDIDFIKQMIDRMTGEEDDGSI